MRTFAGVRKTEDILRQAKALGLYVDDARPRGRDTIKFMGGRGWVIFNDFNGNFFGEIEGRTLLQRLPKQSFSSKSPQFDNEPWFQGLLEFFYTMKEGDAR